MAIQQTKCPHCGNEISVQSEWLGMNLQCPQCQNQFIYQEEQPANPEAAPVIVPAPAVIPAPAVTPAAPGVAPGVVPAPVPAPAVTPQAAPEPPKAGMFTALARYANFSGRANRREYWLFQLFQTLLFSMLYIVSIVSSMLDIPVIPIVCSAIIGIAAIAFLIPNLAVLARRLHDGGHSMFYIFIYFVPCIGGLLLFIALCSGSDKDNKYGPNPNGGGSGEAWPCVLAIFTNILLYVLDVFITIFCGMAIIAKLFTGTALEDNSMMEWLTNLNPLTEAADKGKVASCESKLKTIGCAIVMYQDDNNGKYPPMLAMMDNLPDNIKYSTMDNGNCPYRYLGNGLDLKGVKVSTSSIPLVICDDHPGILQVLYADGHVGAIKTDKKFKSAKDMVEFVLEENNISTTSKVGKTLLENAAI